MDKESIFDKLDTCLCGYKMKKGEEFCLKCERLEKLDQNFF